MAEKLKEIYFTDQFLNDLADHIVTVWERYEKGWFLQMVYDEEWEDRELKQRMRHITECLQKTLPSDYETALDILKQIAPRFEGFDGMVFPDFVECFGLDNWELSMEALEFFTRFSSSEFAVRPFLAENPTEVLAQMRNWADHENAHVRRLASEGCRPKLPWAVGIPILREKPELILPILEKLKTDPSDYVRKSVANNLNDISKDHAEFVLDLCERWYGNTKETDWIVKHACRTMLKSGSPRAMLIFGFADPKKINAGNLNLNGGSVRIGGDLDFAFDLLIETRTKAKVRLEYAVHYMKSNGKLSRKIFQLKEGLYNPGVHPVSKSHSFQDRSTRLHLPGEHKLSIILNGKEKESATFDLVE